MFKKFFTWLTSLFKSKSTYSNYSNKSNVIQGNHNTQNHSETHEHKHEHYHFYNEYPLTISSQKSMSFKERFIAYYGFAHILVIMASILLTGNPLWHIIIYSLVLMYIIYDSYKLNNYILISLMIPISILIPILTQLSIINKLSDISGLLYFKNLIHSNLSKDVISILFQWSVIFCIHCIIHLIRRLTKATTSSLQLKDKINNYVAILAVIIVGIVLIFLFKI